MEKRFDEISEDMLQRSRSAVPDYAAYDDPEFRAAARAHCDDHLRAFLTVAHEQRLLTREELAFVTRQAAMRARQGVPLDALLHVYRMGHEAIFRAILEAGGADTEGMAGALALTGRTLSHVDLITTLFTESYLETQQELRAGAESARRTLIDQAIRGSLEPGEMSDDRARAVGIDPAAEFLVAVCAGNVDAAAGHERLQGVARRLTVGRSVAVVRDREVVALVQTQDRHAARGIVASALEWSGGELAAGLGLPCHGVAAIQRGYAEARAMVKHAPRGDVCCLGDLSVGDYLTLTADETARRLIDPPVAAGLTRDHDNGGTLIATLIAYVAADQNAAAAARALHLHANTMHYRLGKLASETGRDPHRFHDLVELLTAVAVLGLHPASALS